MTEPELTIVGDRVALGPLRRGDYPLHVRWLNDPEVAWNVFGEAVRRSLEEETEWLDRENASDTGFLFLIHVREDGAPGGWRPVGTSNLTDIDRRRGTATFRILIGDAADRGRGLGLAATRLVVRHAFEDLGLRNVALHVFGWNERAVRTYERAGFRLMGRRRGVQPRDGVWHDVVSMDIVRGELTDG